MEKQEILEITESFMTLTELLDRLKTKKRPSGFGNPYTFVDSVNKNTLFITPEQFFNGGVDPDYDVEYIESVEELKELLEFFEYDRGDNTYNYGGYMSNELNFHSYKSEVDDRILVEYNVHVGLDVRVGYIGSVWALYEDDYDFTSHLCDRHELPLNISYTKNDEEHYIGINYEPCNELLSLYFYENDEDYESYDLDLYDIEDFTNSLKEFLDDNEIEYDNLKVEKY